MLLLGQERPATARIALDGWHLKLQPRSKNHSAFEHLDQQEGKDDRYGDAEQNYSDPMQNCGTERRMSSRLLKYPTFGLRELQSFKTPHPSP